MYLCIGNTEVTKTLLLGNKNTTIMNNIKKLTLVTELCGKIDEYVYNHDLFSGGCCYAAYVLAKNLKQLGIKYKTVLYQYDDILNETNFNNAINGHGVSHVAIEVRVGFRKYIIGDCSGILRFFDWSGYRFKIKKYTGISPEEIMEGYRNNVWNHTYNTYYNGPLMRDINKICNHYVNI